MKKLGLFIALSAFCITAIAQQHTINEKTSDEEEHEFIVTESFTNKINKLYYDSPIPDYYIYWDPVELNCFDGGYAKVICNNNGGIINRTGDLVVPLQYNIYSYTGEIVIISENGQSGIIEKNGQITFPLPYDYISKFYNGFAWARKDRKWGIINKNGSLVVPLQYTWCYGGISDGVAWVSKNQQLCIVDTNGNAITPSSRFEAFSHFEDGCAWVKANGRWGLINKHGKIIIPFSAKQYERYVFFHEGLAWMADKNYKKGAIDKTGKVIIPFLYDDYSPFENGLAWVKKNGEWGVINKNGKVVVPFQYTFPCENCDYGSGRMDNDFPIEWQSFSRKFKDGIEAVSKDGKWGLIDQKGNIIVPIQYDIIFGYRKGITYCEKDGVKGLFDSKANYYSFNLNRTFGGTNGEFSIVGYSEGAFLVRYKFKYKEIPISVMGYMDKSENCTITDELIKNIVDRIK